MTDKPMPGDVNFPKIMAEERLERLVEVARGCTGQCRHIRRFLLGLYNAEEWPFELNRLRAIDHSLQLDCLAVLHFMTMRAVSGVEGYIPDGDRVLKGFWSRESMTDGA